MQEDIGKLVLRVTVGGLLLLHGVNKLLNGIDGIKSAVAAHGLPDVLGYGVYIGEVVAPVMVILGLFARVGAGLIVVNMLAAIGLAHLAELAVINQYGGYQLELEAFFLFGALSVLVLGGGRFSVGGGRFN